MNDLLEILKKFENYRILVIGDVMLDCYIEGEVTRISPEAPVPVLNVKSKIYQPGGAANLAANIASMKGKVSLFGFIGRDLSGKKLRQLLDERGIEFYYQESGITSRKERPINNEHQLLRIDYEDTSPKIFNKELLDKLKQKISESDVIVISDYIKGTINQELIDFVKKFNKKIIVDPKPQNSELYSGVNLIKLNEKEATQISGEKDFKLAGKILKEKYKCDILMTRGSHGMALFSDKILEIPTYSREVFDLSGAGDTVLAALSLVVASGGSLEDAAIIANHAAGIAVEKKGTYCVKLDELKRRIMNEEKLASIDELEKIIQNLRKENKKIVWTNGCFDLFHIGHKYSIEKAKEKGDILIVGIDSDESVKRLKGNDRPIYSEAERVGIISSLRFVDYVTVFESGHAAECIKILKPDVYVKSGNYTIDTINQEERKIIEDYGGEICLIKGISDISTTNTLERIKDIFKKNNEI